MAVVPVIAFLTCLYLVNYNVHGGVIRQEGDKVPFKTLCSRKCEASYQDEPADEAFPLYQCSCSKSCSVYGDCCFDSRYKNTTMGRKSKFVCLPVQGHGKYRAVFGCPPGQQSDFCTVGLGVQPPVTSKTTNITYANIFCATCNGERENMVTWNVELSCPSELENDSSTSETEGAKIISRSGNIWRVNEADGSRRKCEYRAHFEDFSFLRGLELRPCVQTKKISDCSISWGDHSIREMCRSYEDPLYFHNTIYKNPHCAECNYLNPASGDCMPSQVRTMLQMGLINGRSVASFCQTRGSANCILSLSQLERGKLYPFSGLLKIKELPRCHEGMRYDPISKRCRKVEKI